MKIHPDSECKEEMETEKEIHTENLGSEVVIENPYEEAAPEKSGAEIEAATYALWIKEHEPGEADLLKQREESRAFLYKPLISIVVPIYETDRNMLTKMIESVLTQTYENWQLCIAEGNSSKSYIREILQSYADRDRRIRIKFLEENKHISGNSNEALSLAEGEFVGFLDHDDELAPFALYEVVKLLNKCPSLDFIYSDEDKIDVKCRRSVPFFKPDWSPDLLLSVNYICHFTVLRTALVKELGGFRMEYDGAQDYDLFLRASKVVSHIAHIPKILYHWREHKKSTSGDVSRKDYADAAGRAALADFLKSNRAEAYVVPGHVKTNYLVRYKIKDSLLVSIIIPFRDKVELLKNCVESILEKTTYREFELILVSNRSTEEETFHYLDSIGRNEKIKILRFDDEFNFSRINNYAVKLSRGDYLLFLNNDTEVIAEDWLTFMLEQAQRTEVGVVGCKLLFPDNSIQHAGVIIGMTGFAGHVFAGLPEHSYTYSGSTDFVRNVTAVTGACMMVRKEIFNKVSGFNESFIICGSDIDFCLRIHEKGYRNIYTPYAVLYHHESASRDSRIAVNDYRLSIKSYRKFLNRGDPYYNPNLTFIKTDCSLKTNGEGKILKEIRENALEQSKSRGIIPGEDKQPKTAGAIHLVEILDFSISDLKKCRDLMNEFAKKRPVIKSINWFIPYFLHVYYGGIYTIFRFADYFSRKGIENRFVLYDSPLVSEQEILEKITSAFPDMRNPEVFIHRGSDVSTIPYADVSIATLWTSAYKLLKFKKTLGKFYFIQDYEPLFYPAGTYYALAEATYRFGFYGIVNSPGLYDFITKNYRMQAEFFVPAVDRTMFFPKENPDMFMSPHGAKDNRNNPPSPPFIKGGKGGLTGEKGEKIKLFLYGRPHHERNAFELAIAAAEKIKALLGDKIEIVSAGSDWNIEDYGVKGVINNLGLLGYEETAKLYRGCDFGLILMFTKHPSYLPMELMASGSIVITNYNEANTWLLKDGTNCIVVEPSPTFITERLNALINNPELQKAIRDNAIKTIESFRWENEIGKIYKFITGKEGNDNSRYEQDSAIAGVNVREVTGDKDTLIRNLQNAIEEKGRYISNLESSVVHLNIISNSHGALKVYYRMRDIIFPVGSRRRTAAKFIWNFPGKLNFKTARLLTRDNIKRSIYYIKNYGFKIFVKKVYGQLDAENVSFLHKPKVPVLNLSTIEEDEITPYEDAAVSVVIPTKNAGSDFELLLSMLREQRGLKDIEIIVVDSGSSDKTVETAETFGARIIEIPPEKFSHSYVRNIGAESATGNYIFFTVQDALPPSRLFLYELFSILKNNDVVAVSCAEFPREDIDLFYSVLLWNHYKFLEVDKNDRILSKPETETHINLRKSGQLSDLACLISRDIFMRYKYRYDYAEDLDLGIRLIKDGHKLAFLNSVKIIHSHNRPPYYFLKRAYIDNLFLTRIFPDYPVPAIQGQRLLREILKYHSISSFVHKELSHIKTPISVDRLFNIVEEKLRSFDYCRYTSSSDYRDYLHMDKDFKSFLRKVSEICHVPEGHTPHDRILINAVLNFLNTAKEYMASSYEIVDDVILEDFKSLIIKVYALQCGAHLAYCYRNDGSIIEVLHSELKRGI